MDAQDYNGNSALSRFLESCPPSADIGGIFELLVSARADVNLKNAQGETPIFSACWNDHAVTLLAQAGADLDARDEIGQTALRHCFVHPEFVKAMIAQGADPFVRDRYGQTAAEAAREMGLNQVADTLEAAMEVGAAKRQ